MTPSTAELALIDRWQRNFPLTARPFAAIGKADGLSEDAVIAIFRKLQADGVISRIGAVVRPNTLGASTLAAMRVPPARLIEVAMMVNAEPRVNHNYERDHLLNLWFVVTAPDTGALAAIIARIEAQSGLEVLNLPLLTAYHLDLAFPLDGTAQKHRADHRPVTCRPDRCDRALLAAIEDGMPLAPRPYELVGDKIGRGEADVIDDIGRLHEAGIVRRFGCVVRHRALGYAANAMAVWDVPDDMVDDIAAVFARHPCVSLCYRRPRHLPDWPFNLFCMIHAKRRDEARTVIAALNGTGDAAQFAQSALFSAHCFKQRGAVFSVQPGELH